MSLLAALLLVPAAFASEAAPGGVRCRDPEQFRAQIYNCGRNPVAVELAKACELDVGRESERVARALAAEMERLNGELARKQNASLEGAQDRLAASIEAMESQITSLQENTERVAGYTRAMIDAPGSEEPATSMDCFNDSFDALQEVVSRLDQKILDAKGARETAIAFYATLGARDQGLGASAGSRAAKAGDGVSGRKSASPGTRPPGAASDITGTLEDQRKRQ